MKLLHVLASTNISAGGPPQAVRGLTAALADRGLENTIVAASDLRQETLEFDQRVHVRVCGTIVNDGLGLGLAPQFPRVLREEMWSADLVHIHGLWHFPQAFGSLHCTLNEIPYVISPHGQLFDWSLGERRLPKRLAWLTYQKRIMKGAGGIHALTQDESEAVAAMNLSANIQVIPNGIDLARVRAVLASAASELNTHLLPSRFILYVGRLHHKKGVFFLLDVFARLARELPDLGLLIAGPDPECMWEKLAIRARELGIFNRVRYLGILAEPTKLRLIELSELVVLPSFSEGMSMVLLEALACATPVVISANCGMPQVNGQGAGRILPLDVRSFSDGIHEVVINPELRDSMSRQALALAGSEFQSGSVAARMVKFYTKSLNR